MHCKTAEENCGSCEKLSLLSYIFFIVLYSDSGCYDLNYGKSSRSIGVQTNSDWKRQLLSESAVKQKVSIQRCNKT